MKVVALLGVLLAACGNDFGSKDPDGGGSGSEAPWAAYCLKLRSCFGDARPISACILAEASGHTEVSPFLRRPRVPNGSQAELVTQTDWWERFLDTRRGCIERATSCAEALTCGNGDGTVCTDWRCRSGDQLDGCYGEGGDLYRFEINCLLQDLECFPNSETGADCGWGNCITAPPDPVCEADALVACQDGIIQHSECGEMGRTCGTGLDGTLGCRGAGADCATAPEAPVDGDPLYPMAAATCEGNVASYCDNGGTTTIDCAASSMMRACVDGVPGGCAPTGDACDPRTFVGACDGTGAQYCVDGNVKTVDCAANGFSSCGLVAGAPGCQ